MGLTYAALLLLASLAGCASLSQLCDPRGRCSYVHRVPLALP